MKYVFKSAFFLFIVSSLFLIQCSNPKKSSKKTQTVSFADVWLSDWADNDGDYFNSYVKLNFDIDVSSDSKDVFVVIGWRQYDSQDTATYWIYFTSADFAITETGDADAKYVSIGSPNDEFPQGSYDLLINVHDSADPDGDPLAQVSATTHADLKNVGLEEAATDEGLNIYDAYWNSFIDNDGDDYASEAELIVDVEVNEGATAEVFLLLYIKPASSEDWALITDPQDITTFVVTGLSDEDAQSIPMSFEIPHDLYDFKVEVFYAEGFYYDQDIWLIEDVHDPSNNSDLNDVPLEPAAEDIAVAIEIYDAEWSDEVDNDGDGYASEANLKIDADVISGGDAAIYAKIYYKLSTSTSYDLLYTTTTFNISGFSSGDKYAVNISNLAHDTYDFKVEAFFSGSTDVQHEMDKNTTRGDDLGGVQFELASEDQAAQAFTLTFNNMAWTDMDIEVYGYGTKVIPAQGSVTYNMASNPGTYSYHAETSGKMSNGTPIGKTLQWNRSHDVSGQTSDTRNLVYTSISVFIYITNTGTANLSTLWVNFGTGNQTQDNIEIPNNGVKYRTGYFNAYSGMEVRMHLAGTQWDVQWIEGNHFTLPWENNQVANLGNTNKNKTDVLASSDTKITLSEIVQYLEPALELKPNHKNVEIAKTDIGYAKQ
jgi:hypothetical protein